MVADVDWQAIRLAYVRGQGSYKQIAEQFGISLNTLTKRAKREGWAQAKRAYSASVSASAQKIAVSRDAKKLAALQDAGSRMCDQLEAIMRDAERELHTHVSMVGEVVTGEAINDKKLYNLSRAIETMTRAMRNLYDIQTVAELEQMRNARQEMALKQREQERRERETDARQAGDGPQEIRITYKGVEDMEAYHE